MHDCCLSERSKAARASENTCTQVDGVVPRIRNAVVGARDNIRRAAAATSVFMANERTVQRAAAVAAERLVMEGAASKSGVTNKENS